MQVDRLLVQRGRAAVEARLADHVGAVRGVDDHEVVRRNRPQADGVGRIRLVGPLPVPVAVRRPRCGARGRSLQHAEHFLHVVAAELLRGRERQLERRALHVVDQDVQVVGIDQRVLGRRVEEIRRVAARRTDRAARCWPRAPPPSGRCGGRRAPRAARWRQSSRDSRPSRTRRARRCRCRARARWSTPPRARCPRAAPSRSRAAAAADSRRDSRGSASRAARRTVEIVLEIRGQDFGGEPALREHDQLQLAASGTPPRCGAFRPDTSGGCRAAG